jgi:hypothetical protein
MATLPKGEIPLTLGGVSYTLTLNIGTIMAAEQQAQRVTGEVVSWDDLVTRCMNSHVSSAVILFWALFQKKHPEVTLEATASLIERYGLGELANAFAVVLGETQPDPKDLAELGQGKNARPRKARAGTGGSTTSTPAPSLV